MKEVVDSFESNSSGYVSQEYLENDVEDGLDTVKDTAIKYTDEANSIIDSVSHIVSITQIDESNLFNDVNRGKEDAEDIVEKLHELDKSQVDAMESTKEDLHTMKNYVTELETMFKDGDLSIGDYSVKAVKDLESLRMSN